MTGGGGGGALGVPSQGERYPYHTGSIMKIRMHNFLTYADAEVRPGPRLNMVVGPNGSGKSTILCAVSLGLGANYTALERAGSVGDFVMRDKEKGWVEITLKGKKPRDPDVVIRRDLERGTNKSKWRLDEEVTTHTRVQEMVKDLGIEVNNLCTFLPQEKVGKFTEMDAQQLLVETEKSLTATDLHDTHNKLVDKQKSMQSADKDLATAKSELGKKEQQLANLARSKEQLENREKLLAKASVFDKVALSLKFTKNQRGATRARAEKDRLEAELKAVQASVEPFKQRVQTFKEAAANANAAQQRSAVALEKAGKAMETACKTVDDRLDGLHTAKVELKSLAQARARLEEKHRKTQGQLQAAITLRDKTDVAALKEQAAEKAAKLREAKRDHDVQAEVLRRAKQDEQEAVKDAKDAEGRLKGMQDLKQRRLRHLASMQRGTKFGNGEHAVRAYMWVEKNRHRFHGRVYGPVALEMSVESQEHAAMVEQQILGHILLSFVVENEHDKQVLMDECKDKQKLLISVSQLSDRWMQELNQEYYTAQDLEELRGRGIQGVMESYVQAPDAVKSVLRNFSNLHRVLVGDDKTERGVSQGLMEELCRRGGSGALGNGGRGGQGGDDDARASAVVYTRRQSGRNVILNVHRANVSRYNGEVSTSSRGVEPAKLLGAFGSDQEHDGMVKEAQARLAEANARVAQMGKAIQDAMELEEAAGKQRQRLEKEGKQLKEHVAAAQNAKEKVKRLTEALQGIEAELQQDAGEQRRAKAEAAMEAARVMVDAVVAMGDRLEQRVGAWAARAPPKLAHSSALKLQAAAERDQRVAAERHQGLVDEVEKAKKTYRGLMDVLKKQKTQFDEALKLKEDAEKVKRLLDGDFNHEEQQEEDESEEECFDRLVGLAEVERDSAQEEAGQIADNPEAIAQYHRVSKEVAALGKRVGELQQACESGQSDLERLAAPWAASLRNLTAKLTERFKEYMTQMGCEGQVTLEEAADDYAAWRLQIWVKFRKEATLQQLSAKVHSGGERSVSTILFLMGLQDVLGASPFRAVDEINQGMDERNERLVFSRIVANSTKNQYFLVTPKLLPGLTAMEMDHVTVLFVFNAPELLPFDRWDVRAFLQAAARRKGLGGSGGGASGGKRARPSGAQEEDKEESEGEGGGDDGRAKGGGGKKRRSEGDAVSV